VVLVRNVFLAWVAAFLLLALAGRQGSIAAAASVEEGFGKGFRGVPWGASLDEARKAWPDLVQETYGADGEPDHFVRDRSKEEPRIEGNRFDRIEYLFRKGAFAGVVATIRTNASHLHFGFVREKVEARAGKPREADEEHALWADGKARVELSRRLNSVWLRVTAGP
jgi:hypothetical protein